MKSKKTWVWLIIIILWALVTIPGYSLVNDTLVPSPYQVFLTFIDILINGYNQISFFTHLGTSFGRLFSAIFFAVLTAVPLGLLSGYNQRVETIVSTIVEFVRPLPPLAYYMLLVLWLGIGNTSKVVLLYIAAFAPIYLSCIQAVKLVRRDYLMQAQTLGADRGQIFIHIIFPSALPNIFTGIRTATGVAYTTLVSAEMVAAISGIGWMILDASNYLKSDVMFVGIIFIGISAILFDKCLQWLENRVVFWKGQSS